MLTSCNFRLLRWVFLIQGVIWLHLYWLKVVYETLLIKSSSWSPKLFKKYFSYLSSETSWVWLFSKELHSPVCTVHKSPATQYITPRELVVTHLIALSPSKFLFYVLHCFHLRTELPWKYPQQIRITILFRNSDFKQSPVSKSPATQYITPRELVVTYLIAL